MSRASHVLAALQARTGFLSVVGSSPRRVDFVSASRVGFSSSVWSSCELWVGGLVYSKAQVIPVSDLKLLRCFSVTSCNIVHLLDFDHGGNRSSWCGRSRFSLVMSHEVSPRSLGLWWSVLLTMGELHSCRFLMFFYSGSGELFTYSAMARRMQTPFVAATTLRCFGAVEVEVSCSC